MFHYKLLNRYFTWFYKFLYDWNMHFFALISNSKKNCFHLTKSEFFRDIKIIIIIFLSSNTVYSEKNTFLPHLIFVLTQMKTLLILAWYTCCCLAWTYRYVWRVLTLRVNAYFVKIYSRNLSLVKKKLKIFLHKTV